MQERGGSCIFNVFGRTPLFYFCPPSGSAFRTFCVSRYSASSWRCKSKSSCRSRLMRCCSMSRTTPSCIAYHQSSVLCQRGFQRGKNERGTKTYSLLGFLLKVHKDDCRDREEGSACQSNLGTTGGHCDKAVPSFRENSEEQVDGISR